VSLVPPIALEGVAPVASTERTSKPGGVAEAFGKALAEARDLETQSTQAAEKFAHGDPSMGIHEVMIASEKANIAIRYATTLKNKALEAYRELMNTQV
jgi:flagellar hook-basal body complex protein FliE